ncbi:helix-turn-helix domain-containing protein [Ornithinimicrobium tianjinense]|uniref:HTH cro/C1-type domain-containing protein n=1 Tax=Ornithinimicrobium tianjinense TaxID=1195761 RepID=A0A917BK82_9MICO|nr:helix-turn-helix transcriptional regulator [Ornithinimicrobium tianjinense]GGF49070.1 hypothetical protein GCM10011366_16200 [Ornithinimicrobium tianjinense]
MTTSKNRPLRDWRERNRLTLDEVADLTGLSKGYVCRLEHGQRTPAPLTRVRIARRLGVAVRDIFPAAPLPEAV